MAKDEQGPGTGSRSLPARSAPVPGLATPVPGLATPIGDLLRVPPGPVDLGAIDPRGTPGFEGNKTAGKAALKALDAPIDEQQERLFAQGRAGGHRRLLLVLQGMDTSGKGGTMRHAVGLMDPQGVHIKAFRAPTAAEQRHDFLWRIRRELPEAGIVGVFDRSHYEDVLVPRVRGLVGAAALSERYDASNAFEAELVESGCAVVKIMLHISAEEQKQRLLARLDDPTKHWKHDPADIAERALWGDYQRAYEIALERCSAAAPWHVVPADRKWYRNLAVAALLLEHLAGMGLEWPPADFDVAAERERLLAS